MKVKTAVLALSFSLLLILLTGCSGNGASVSEPKEKTLFIYMCGSNLETKKGLACKNIDEILSAEISGDMNIVIETGGALQWQDYDIDSNVLSRYEISGGRLKLVKTLDQASMGDADTLTDFLTWGQEHYPAEHTMLIFWDHGAGPTGGVCFDENYDFDCLTLNELAAAFENAGLSKKFDMIGFDACLMASIETAAAVKDYADYMIASEEIEPSGGWDYKALTEAFGSDGESLDTAQIVCESYIKKCRENGKGLLATLSVFDLAYTDNMLKQLDFALQAFIEDRAGSSQFSSIISAMRVSEKFGGSNSYQGAANLIDFPNFIAHLIRYESTTYDSTDAVNIFLAANDFIPYVLTGGDRRTFGVSFFYPLVYDREAIKDYISLGINERYNEFLTELYLNAPDTTIEYTDQGSATDDGAYTVSITPGSVSYISSVDFILSRNDDDGTQHIICTDNDIEQNSETLVFKSNFQGSTLALDGHPLFYTATTSTGEYVQYSAPVTLNGKPTNLQFIFIKNNQYTDGGYYSIAGTWDGYDENGLPAGDLTWLEEGDKIQVATDITMENGMPKENWSEEFTIGENGGEISILPLDGTEYQYTYVITDIFGYTFLSDTATLEITAGGGDPSKDPPQDGSRLATVTDIRPAAIQYDAGSY